ncbi:macrophage mannose receptor 1 [Anoplophora glabripennis]|uniref:macrophage mannose receptor 1 n=1 Tax=Anoplophora glabripennis TaxID=217634 RepID=UPI0008738E4A|nr:macrophage mannose receptor 1 [Anoplophora glabripennis]
MHYLNYVLLLSFYLNEYYLEAATTAKTSSDVWDHTLSSQSSSIPLFEFGEKSYYISKFKLTFLEAYQFCQEIQMKLVTIHSSEEVDALTKFVRQAGDELDFWTSGSRLVDSKIWIWMSTMEVVEYTKWSNGQPDYVNEQCLELWFVGTEGLYFNNRDCASKQTFICEKNTHLPRITREAADAGCLSSLGSHYIFPNTNLLNFEGKSYYIGNYFKATFLQASQFCQMIGMKLVSIESEAENVRLYKYIRDTIAGDGFWSSGSKLVDGKNIIWLSTGRMADYTNWMPNQPDNAKEMCIELVQRRNDGLFWNDLNCDDKLFFICEQNDNILSRNAESIIEEKSSAVQSAANIEPATEYPENPTLPITTIDGVKYRISKFNATQEKALLACRQYGMELVSILDKAKNDIITKLIQQHNSTDNYWVSAKKKPDNKWIWWELQPMVYTNWADSEPNNLGGSEFCIVFRHTSGLWNDINCESDFYFICESRNNFNPSSNPTVNIYVNNNHETVTQYPDNPNLLITTVDGVKYRVSKFKATQEKASESCRQYGMALASVLDQGKSDVILKVVQQNNSTDNYWVSAKKQPDKKWIWSELQPMVYTNWAPNEPNNVANNEFCIEFLRTDGKWNDINCMRDLYFVCESLNFNPSSKNCDCDGSFTQSKKIASLGDGYNVAINNNIGTSNSHHTVLSN